MRKFLGLFSWDNQLARVYTDINQWNQNIKIIFSVFRPLNNEFWKRPAMPIPVGFRVWKQKLFSRWLLDRQIIRFCHGRPVCALHLAVVAVAPAGIIYLQCSIGHTALTSAGMHPKGLQVTLPLSSCEAIDRSESTREQSPERGPITFLTFAAYSVCSFATIKLYNPSVS